MMESISKGTNAPTGSIYAKAASFLFVNNGGEISIKQAITFAGCSESNYNIDKQCYTVNCCKRRLIKQMSALLKVPPTTCIVQ